jgi:hypothetical protein
MKIKTEDLLPKIAAQGGTVHKQLVKCGKPSCKCARGELHGPYYYYFVRVGGRLKKRYLKHDDVKAIQVACRSRREDEKATRQQTRQAQLSVRQIIARLRALQRDFF